MHTINATAISYQPYFARIAAFMACVCAVAVLLYGIFLLEAVSNAGGRQSAATQIHTVSQHLSSLEAQYLTQTQALTPIHALSLGFVAPTTIATVVASQSPGLSFSAPASTRSSLGGR